MAERFKNIYITAREFINNWEKEVYELTQLDYFIYLLINEIGAALENDYMAGRPAENAMRLDKQEIASLAFALGDSLYTFLDKNCFGACSLGCPNKLSKPFTQKEEAIRAGIAMREFDGNPMHCRSREECLFHDVMSYVIVDVLIDFYNYELVVEVDENDPEISKLALFIMDSILAFTHKNGPLLLKMPGDPAMDDFNEILSDDTSEWDEDILENVFDDDDMEEESWKFANLAVTSIIKTFQEDRPGIFTTALTQKLLLSFSEYLEDYLSTNHVDGFEFSELTGFFQIELPQAFILDDEFSWEQVVAVFTPFFEYIDAETGKHLKSEFKAFCDRELADLQRVFSATRLAQQKFSFLDFMLDPHNDAFKPVEGYYEIVDVEPGGFTFSDIHLNQLYRGIDLGEAATVGIKPGDIVHGHLAIQDDHGWLKYVEQVYVPASKFFLY